MGQQQVKEEEEEVKEEEEEEEERKKNMSLLARVTSSLLSPFPLLVSIRGTKQQHQQQHQQQQQKEEVEEEVEQELSGLCYDELALASKLRLIEKSSMLPLALSSSEIPLYQQNYFDNNGPLNSYNLRLRVAFNDNNNNNNIKWKKKNNEKEEQKQEEEEEEEEERAQML